MSTLPQEDELSLTKAVALALVVGVATALATLFGMHGTGAQVLASLDFNAALFEDFLGPYWRTGAAIAEGHPSPAQGYIYPATLACLIAPLATTASRMGVSPAAMATGGALALIVFSFATLVAATFSLRRPRGRGEVVLAGGVLGLTHAAVHGVYWAQASLPAIALVVAAFALRERGKPVRAGIALGLGIAIKLHPAAALAIFLFPLSRAGLAAALLSVLSFGVLVPLAWMERASYASFHETVVRRLDVMASTVLTREGGRGAQDVPALLIRTVEKLSPFGARAIGIGVALGLFALAERSLRAGRRSALIYLAAIPFAAVSPTWPHGLLWVPVAWWLALGSRSWFPRSLALASFAAGSTVALRAAGSPETYAWYGLPAVAAALALAATFASDLKSA